MRPAVITVKAKKQHPCQHCRKPILAGEDCVSETIKERKESVAGEHSTRYYALYWHIGCWSEMAKKEYEEREKRAGK